MYIKSCKPVGYDRIALNLADSFDITGSSFQHRYDETMLLDDALQLYNDIPEQSEEMEGTSHVYNM